MKDDKGLYYHPYPQNPRVRMYVRMGNGEICFRMWNRDDPDLWQEHGWVPYGAIRQALAMYAKKDGFDPKRAYDIDVARALLKENG